MFAVFVIIPKKVHFNGCHIWTAFYNQLASVFSGMPRTDKLLLKGDFNARKGSDNDKWPMVMCKHGLGNCKSNWLCALS